MSKFLVFEGGYENPTDWYTLRIQSSWEPGHQHQGLWLAKPSCFFSLQLQSRNMAMVLVLTGALEPMLQCDTHRSSLPMSSGLPTIKKWKNTHSPGRAQGCLLYSSKVIFPQSVSHWGYGIAGWWKIKNASPSSHVERAVTTKAVTAASATSSSHSSLPSVAVGSCSQELSLWWETSFPHPVERGPCTHSSLRGSADWNPLPPFCNGMEMLEWICAWGQPRSKEIIFQLLCDHSQRNSSKFSPSASVFLMYIVGESPRPEGNVYLGGGMFLKRERKIKSVPCFYISPNRQCTYAKYN